MGLLGPSYDYKDKINSPGDLGMSVDGMKVGANFRHLNDFIRMLTTGGGEASKPGNRALGNKFFVKTPAKCEAEKTGKKVDRYLYVDNVPTGSMYGLIPGIFKGMEKAIDPTPMFNAFTKPGTPKCKKITRQTIWDDESRHSETQYVALEDIEGFSVLFDKNNKEIGQMPDDYFVKLYFTSLGLLGLYMFYRLTKMVNN